jgi:hypothetical protein
MSTNPKIVPKTTTLVTKALAFWENIAQKKEDAAKTIQFHWREFSKKKSVLLSELVDLGIYTIEEGVNLTYRQIKALIKHKDDVSKELGLFNITGTIKEPSKPRLTWSDVYGEKNVGWWHDVSWTCIPVQISKRTTSAIFINPDSSKDPLWVADIKNAHESLIEREQNIFC